MPQTTTIECPAGLVLTVREFKVSDEDYLNDPEARRAGITTNHLLEAITVSVQNPGRYQLGADGKLPWGRVLQGERVEILRRNRIDTWGAEGDLRDECPKCTLSTENTFDLSKLPIKPLPETSVEHVEKGTPIRFVLPRSGVKVGFRLLRGDDDKALAQIKKLKKAKQSSAYHLLRLVEVEGIAPASRQAWVEDLGALDSSALRAAYDQGDCGVDTACRWKCEHCDHEWEDDLVLMRFLFPKFRGKIAMVK